MEAFLENEVRKKSLQIENANKEYWNNALPEHLETYIWFREALMGLWGVLDHAEFIGLSYDRKIESVHHFFKGRTPSYMKETVAIMKDLMERNEYEKETKVKAALVFDAYESYRGFK